MASITKRGKYYQVRYFYKDADGKRHTKNKSGFKTKAAARLFASQTVVDVNSGLTLNPDQMTFAEYFDYWYKTYKEQTLAYQTKQRYKITSNVIKKYFQDKMLSDITRPTYQAFITEYGSEHAKDTVIKVNAQIRACVKNAIFDDLIIKDFTYKVQLVFNKNRERKVEYLNIDEIKHIIRYLSANHNRHYTSKYMILTALFTGARLGEIMALKWNDINFNFKTISINKSWNYQEGGGFKDVKNKSSNRTIRVDSHFLKILSELKQNNKEMVFTDQYGTIPSSVAVNKTLRGVLKLLGIKKRGFHFHSLRHSHVAYLLANHMDIYAISKRLGHSDISTTLKVYAYLIEEYKAQTDSQIENLLDDLFVNSPIPINQNKAIN